MSRSTSFCPSTIATRSSSCWVALNNMRFTYFSPARAGAPFSAGFSPCVGKPCEEKSHLRALLLRSLLGVSEITPGSGPAHGRAGGGFQGPARGPPGRRVLWSLCLATRGQTTDNNKNEGLKQATGDLA